MRFNGTMTINQKGRLEIGCCDTVDLAREFGTPLYVLDEALFRQNCRDYRRAFNDKYGAEVIYAGKTLLNLAVCRMVDEEGLGLDVVSGGELYTALKAGFPAGRVYFHGNNKSPSELEMLSGARTPGKTVLSLTACLSCELELLTRLPAAGGSRAGIDFLSRTRGWRRPNEYVKTGR
jgi:diaminopimelate decarboxylase